MDSSVLYMSLFVLCLLLSLFIYKKFLVVSDWQEKFSALVDTGGKFVIYLALLVVVALVILSTNQMILGSIVGIFPFVLVVLGSILFQTGFARMYEIQLLRNIPRSKIRSVAMGAVEISGSIVSKNLLTTPYSKSPCVYFRSELEIYSEDGETDSDKFGGWERVAGPTFKEPFWVKDETGEIMVDPDCAEFMISNREFGMLGQDGSPDNADDAVSENFSPKAGDRRYVEQFLGPNDTVFILGTASLRKDGETEQLLIQVGTGGSPFIISDSREKYAVHQKQWDMLAGFSYGIIIFITGFMGILYLSELL